MSSASVKEILSQLGPIKDIARNKHGSQESITLVSTSNDIDIIQGSRVLAKCGISLLKAKRALDQIAATGETIPLLLPKVPDLNELLADLKQIGIKANAMTAAHPGN